MTMRAAKTMVALAAALGMASVGCGAAPDDGSVDENISSAYDENGDPLVYAWDEAQQDGVMAVNGLTTLNGVTSINGWLSSNGILSINGVTNINGMTTINGITSINGMTTINGFNAVNGLTTINGSTTVDGLPNYVVIPNRGDMMNTSSGRNTIAYLVKCALRSDQFIERSSNTGTKYKFWGSVGLADYWLGNGSGNRCDLACEEWVSACMMAHYNPSGQHIEIMMVAGHSRIGWGNPNKSYYDEPEAAWYGNFFTSPPRAQYCDWLGGGDRDGCVDQSSCPIKRADDYCNDDDGVTRMTMTGVKYYDTALLNSTNCKDGICVGTFLTSSPSSCGGYKCAYEYTRPIMTWLEDGL